MDAGHVVFGEKTQSKYLQDDGYNAVEVVADEA